jgi:hypothetical protein
LAWLVRLGALVVATSTIGVGVHALGLAGYRLGWLWAGALVVVLPVLAAWRWIGSDAASRIMWVIAVAVAGVTALAWLVDHAPLSKGQLADQFTGLTPDFTKTISETRTGHSWCRPHCPRVTRVLRAPDTSPFYALLTTAAAMRVKGIITTLEPVGRRHPEHYLRIPSHRMVADVRAERRPGYIRLTITLTATRGRVRNPGPLQSDRTVTLTPR